MSETRPRANPTEARLKLFCEQSHCGGLGEELGRFRQVNLYRDAKWRGGTKVTLGVSILQGLLGSYGGFEIPHGWRQSHGNKVCRMSLSMCKNICNRCAHNAHKPAECA